MAPLLRQKGKPPCFRDFGRGLGVTQELSGSSGVVSSDYTEDVTRSSTFPPGLCVLPDVKQHKKIWDIFISVPNGSKKRKAIYTSKKPHRNLLNYWSELSLDLAAFLLLPYPDVHFTLCPFIMGRCGAEPSILKCSFKEREEQIPPSTLLSHWDFSRAGDRTTSHGLMTESPQSCIRKGPWAGDGWQIYTNPTFTNTLESASASGLNYSLTTQGAFHH